MPKKNNSRHMRAKSIPDDASSSDEIRHVHVVGKIEGHGGIIKGGPFIPTPNFHIHRSGISLCGTLYFFKPEENLHDIETILKAFDNGAEPKVIIDKWVDSTNARQIKYSLDAPTNERSSKEYFIKHFGRVQGEKINQNVLLGYEMAAQQVPGVLTEEYYGEKEPLADKSFGGRQSGDLPDAFVPETTEDGPALCIYGVFVKNKYHKVSKCQTLSNGVKMSDLHYHVRSMRGIKETDIVHFHFLDTTCNFDDLGDQCGSFPLVSHMNRELMHKKYEEYYKKANEMDVEEVEEKPAKRDEEKPRRKRSSRKTKKNIVSKSKRLKVSLFTKRRMARVKARVEAMAEDLSFSSNSKANEEAIAEKLSSSSNSKANKEAIAEKSSSSSNSKANEEAIAEKSSSSSSPNEKNSMLILNNDRFSKYREKKSSS